MLLFLKKCLEGKCKYSNEERVEYILNSKEPICKLTPSLEGHELDLDDFERYTPEKLEYYNDHMFGDKMVSMQLLNLLMYHLGVKEVVKLVPKEVWEEALKNYKDDEQ